MNTLLERAEQQFQAGSYGLDPSLLLYLPLRLKDSATFPDNSAYGHLCTRTGALPHPQGNWFEGTDDNILITGATALVRQDFTVAVWARYDTVSDERILISQGTAALVYWYVGRWDAAVAGTDIRFWVYTVGSAASGIVPVVGNWYHVVAVSDTTSLRIFVNGQLRGTGVAGIAGISDRCRIGKATSAAGCFFNGVEDEVRIERGAWSALKVARDYEETKGFYQ